jgi:O-antigen/teichoic acid export membrane protein
MLGFSLTGVFIGFAVAPIVGFLMGILLTKKAKPSGKFDWKKLADFAWPVIIFSVAISFLISADLFSVKSLLGQNTETGYYNAATTIARVPYTILGVVCSALFPIISGTMARKEKAKTKMYIKETLRYVLMILMPLTLLVAATSKDIINILYTEEYISASGPLSILMVGFLFLTVFSIFASVVCAEGKPKYTMALSLLLVAISLILNRILIPIYGLSGAAYATLISCLIGMLILYAYTKKRFGSIVDFISISKIILASIPIYLLSSAITLASPWLLLAEYPILFLLYFAILKTIGEIKTQDIERIKRNFTFLHLN